MSISANMVRDLREKTAAGMLDCKKALEETKGDFEAAVEWLRKKGLASASKKSDRLASEGIVMASVHGNSGSLVEVNSETDFVAKNDLFKVFVKELADYVATTKAVPADPASLLELPMKSGQKFGDALKESISKIGENLVLRRFVRFDSTGVVHTYIHGDGKIGVMVDIGTDKAGDDVRTFANDICLHIAAMSPLALNQEQVPAAVVEKEKEILRGKALEQGKKPEMLDKIVEGQIRKFLAESCLLEQAFVKNPDLNVKAYAAETAKKVGGTVTINRFVRYELGEGLAKRANNFAEEVAAQTKGH